MSSSQFSYGRKVRDLLLELKRSDWLPVYNDSLVRDVIEEINALDQEIIDTIECVARDVAALRLTCCATSPRLHRPLLVGRRRHRGACCASVLQGERSGCDAARLCRDVRPHRAL